MSNRFTIEFRKVSPAAAASAMLFSEELCGSEAFANSLQIAIENIQHDTVMLSHHHPDFSADCTTDDALKELLKEAHSLLRHNNDMLPDEAITSVVEEHATRRFATPQDAADRIKLVHEAFSMARQITAQWAKQPA